MRFAFLGCVPLQLLAKVLRQQRHERLGVLRETVGQTHDRIGASTSFNAPCVFLDRLALHLAHYAAKLNHG